MCVCRQIKKDKQERRTWSRNMEYRDFDMENQKVGRDDGQKKEGQIRSNFLMEWMDKGK